MKKAEKNNYTYKSVRKAIRKEKRKINGRKDIQKIEKLYLCQKAIKNYYQKYESKISDDDLIHLYNKEYKPNILKELAVGLMSGFLASSLEKIINVQFPFMGETNMDKFMYFIALVIVFIIFAIIFFFLLLFIYNQLSSLDSYEDQISDYHREVLDKYIKERKDKFEKRDKHGSKHSEKNRKHK